MNASSIAAPPSPGNESERLRRARSDFPALRAVPGRSPIAYLDNAATSLKPDAVIRAIREFQESCAGSAHRAVHRPGAEATRRYEAARERVARFVDASSPQGVVFVSGATMAINLVAHGWGRKFLRPGDRILVTEMEHHSNLVPWQQAARERGARMVSVPALPDGTLDEEAFSARLREGRVALAAVTHASNVLGTVNPVRRLIQSAHAAGALFLLDAAQTAPCRPIRFREMDCDFLVFSGHKMCGPTGIGVLVARPGLLEEMDPFLFGGGMVGRVDLESATWAEPPRRFEAGTPDVAGAVGLAAAAGYLDSLGMEAVASRVRELVASLAARLRGLPGVRVFGAAPDRCGAVSFDTAGIHPHDLAQLLDGAGVAVRAGALCAQPLMERLGVPAVTRASVSFYNTETDLDRLVAGIRSARSRFGHDR